MFLRTFLVEDSPIILPSLTERLASLPIELVGTACSEEAAVDWLLENPTCWQLLIVDLFLTSGCGLGVLAACRVRSARQRVVVLSNYATQEMRRQCRDYGADAFFDKSTELDSLIEYCLAY